MQIALCSYSQKEKETAITWLHWNPQGHGRLRMPHERIYRRNIRRLEKIKKYQWKHKCKRQLMMRHIVASEIVVGTKIDETAKSYVVIYPKWKESTDERKKNRCPCANFPEQSRTAAHSFIP